LYQAIINAVIIFYGIEILSLLLDRRYGDKCRYLFRRSWQGAHCGFFSQYAGHHEAGQKAIVPYAKGLIMMMFPWLAYILAIIVLTPRLGFLFSLTTGFTLYVVFALIILRKF
jgi:hypothetical protein